MRKVIIMLVLIIMGGLGGFFYLKNRAITSRQPAQVNPAGRTVEDKTGETSLTGKIQPAGEKYNLMMTNGQSQLLDSYNLDLSQYQGKSVTVTGQFSGDELFVTEVKLIN